MNRPALTLSYPARAQLGEFLQAGCGVAVTAAPLIFLALPRWVAATFCLLAALFLGHLLKTLARQMARIELSEEGIRIAGPFATSLGWRDLRHFALRYYPRSRDGKQGWMRLSLRGAAGRTLGFDSDLDGFDRLLGIAIRAGIANDVGFSDTTQANLASVGHVLPDPVTRHAAFAAPPGAAAP